MLLVRDLHGTVWEIGPDPSQTVAVPDALDVLRRLSLALKQVVVLSSRTSAELPRLVPLRSVRLIGDSGLPPLPPDEKRALERFNAEAAKLGASIPGARIHSKPATTTLRQRQAPITL